MYDPGTYRGNLKSSLTTEEKTGSLQVVLTFAIRLRWDGSDWKEVPEQDRRLYLPIPDAALLELS